MLLLGELQSVGRIGSQTISTRIRSLCRTRSCWTAEAPRRQVAHVGERSNTSPGTFVSASKGFSNSLKFAFDSVTSCSWPRGTEEGPHRYNAATSSNKAITPIIAARFFIAKTDPQLHQRFAAGTKSSQPPQATQSKATRCPPTYPGRHIVLRDVVAKIRILLSHRKTQQPRTERCKKALASPIPRAPANPSGRQLLIVATAAMIAVNDADVPVPCFTFCLHSGLRALHDGSVLVVEGQLAWSRDTNDNSARSLASFAFGPQHLAH